MKKITIELTESELGVIASALQYTKAYKGVEIYETVLQRITEQLKNGTSAYYVVKGLSNDGICRCTKAVLVRATSIEHAKSVAQECLEKDSGEVFTPVAAGLATKNYGLCEVL